MNRKTLNILIVVGLLVYLMWQGAGPSIPADVPIQVTYVYEQRDGHVPPLVEVALNELNRRTDRKIIAQWFEDDGTDKKGGSVPEQFKVALAEAQKSGEPCLVVNAGEKVLAVVKDPQTKEQVLEAVP